MTTPAIGIRLSVDGATRAEAELRRVQSSVGGLGAEVTGLGGALDRLRGGFAAVGGAAAAYAVGRYALGVISAADALQDMSERTGVAVRTLAQYQQIAIESGTALGDVAAAIQRLTLAMSQAEGGVQEQQRALRALGITARDPNEAFLQLADTVANSADPLRRAADLQQVLGRGYAEMIPLLRQGAQGIRDAAAASESFADTMARLAPNAAEFNDNLSRLRERAAGAAAGILVRLVPAANKWHDAIRDALRDASALETLYWLSPLGLQRIQRRLAAEAEAVAQGRRVTGVVEGVVRPVLPGAQPAPEAPRPLARTTTRPPADPLESLLRQTEVRQLQDFERMVGALNLRLDSGRVSVELYNQAMTRLVKTTFADRFRAGEQAERAREQAAQASADWAQQEREHLEATTNAIRAQEQAWVDAGRALEREMRTPAEAANVEMGRLDEMLRRGVVSWETYARATMQAMESITAAKEPTRELADAAERDMQRLTRAVEGWGASFTATLVDIVTGGKGSFRDLANSIISDLARIHLQRTITAPLMQAGSDWLGGLLGGLIPGRALGGPVLGGRPYLVGERGPELFVPRVSGSITPNNALRSGGAVTINQTYHFHGPADRGVVVSAAQLGAAMARQQMRDDIDRGRV